MTPAFDPDAYRRATVRRLAVTLGSALWREETGTAPRYRGGSLLLDEDALDDYYERQQDPEEFRVQSVDEGLLKRRGR